MFFYLDAIFFNQSKFKTAETELEILEQPFQSKRNQIVCLNNFIGQL